jgi:hypothetical protein
VLCHTAMRVWRHSSRGNWHLYTAIRTGSSLILRRPYRWMLEWMLTSFCPGASTR